MKLSKDHRLYGLDVLRFGAAVSVFVYHQVLNASAVVGFPLTSSLVSGVGRYGILGVHAFFILSGFVILDTALKTDSSGFFASRFARIMPTFALCALASMVIAALALGRQPSLALYAANLIFIPQAFGFQWIDGVFWTLRYELQFYGFVFLLLATGQLRRLAMPLTCLWLAVAVIQAAGALPDWLRHIFVADYAPLFIVGIGLFWCVEAPTAGRVLLVVVATLVAVVGELPGIAKLEAEIHLPLNRWIWCGAVAALPLLFLLALRLRLSRLSALCYLAGGISYPLYLLHNNLSLALMPRLGLWLGLAAIFGAASAVFLLDERVRYRVRSTVARQLRRLWDQAAYAAQR